MSKLHHYLSLIVFIAAVMMGVQAPNFVDQYVKRVDAHYLEVEANFSKYREAADRYHDGSIESLIEKYQLENDPTFRAGAEAIQSSYIRLQRFEAEKSALAGGLWSQMGYLLLSGDREVMSETYANYSANVPLNADAGICGIVSGTLASVLLEIVLSLFGLFSTRKQASC